MVTGELALAATIVAEEGSRESDMGPIVVETFVVALIFACIFLFGNHLQIHRQRWRRAGLSLAAGVSVAYVFVKLLPELSEAAESFVEATADRSPWMADYRVHLAAMAGFVVFYGLEHLVARSRRSQGDLVAFRLQIGGFAAYVALVSYLLIDGTAQVDMSIALYAVAMGLHLLGIDHAMLREHDKPYLRSGRHLLAAAALAGWGIGMLVELPTPIVTLLAGVISGGVIINAMVMELPADREGRFWPFLIGTLIYAAILLLAIDRGRSGGASG